MLFEDTHQKWGTAASHIRAGLILREFETKVGRQVLCPRIQLVCDRTELGNIDVVFRFGRIEIVQGGVQNPGRGEKGNGTGQAGRLARKGRQETCFSDIFIVDILGIFSTNVFFAQENWQAGQRCGESRAISYRPSKEDNGAFKTYRSRTYWHQNTFLRVSLTRGFAMCFWLWWRRSWWQTPTARPR